MDKIEKLREQIKVLNKEVEELKTEKAKIQSRLSSKSKSLKVKQEELNNLLQGQLSFF